MKEQKKKEEAKRKRKREEGREMEWKISHLLFLFWRGKLYLYCLCLVPRREEEMREGTWCF